MNTKQTFENKLNYLRNFRDSWIKISSEMLNANKRKLFPLDLFMLGLVKRSMLLTKGFCELIKQNNFLSAAPIVRLHIDNLLNVHATFIVSDPHDFATKKMQGEETKNMKDKNGKKIKPEMTDTYLAKSLSKKEETKWVLNAYKETSKFVHLSDKQIFSVAQKIEKEDFQFVISDEQEIPEENLLEATEAMISITEQLFRHMYGWIQAKNRKS
jgi:hypothetical protein